MKQHQKTQKVAKNQETGTARSSNKRLNDRSLQHPYLQAQNIIGNHGLLNCCNGVIQTKLKVGQPNDKYEQEADRVAEQVMRMSDADVAQRVERGAVQPVRIQRMCAGCEEEEMIQAKESPGQTPQVTSNLESKINTLKGSGQPLDSATRSFFEPRFGHDFSQVRVHSDNVAADTAKSINAHAFTLDSDVVFGSGEYQPQSDKGMRLLGHELTHVIQQGTAVHRLYETGKGFSHSSVFPETVIQRACDQAIGEPKGCDWVPDYGLFRSGQPIYRFKVNCDEFSSGEDTRLLTEIAYSLPSSVTIKVHGYASVDGDATFNHNLACARALAANTLLLGNGVSPSRITNIYNHGQTPGPTADRRSVTIEVTQPTPAPPTPAPQTPGTPTLTPPTPGRCPGPVKTVTVDFVQLHGATLSPALQLGAANTIFFDSCVRFRSGANPPRESQATTESWLGGDTDVDRTHGAGCGIVGGEEQVMFDSATRNHGLSSRMRVFFVESYSGSGGAGYSIPPYCATGAEAPYVNHVVLQNSASTSTNPLAHEFGHILLNRGNHSTSPNLMAPSGGTDLTPAQCATIYSNA